MTVHRIERPAKSERLNLWLEPIVEAARNYVAKHVPDHHFTAAATYGPQRGGGLIHGDKLWHALQVVNIAESIANHQRLGHLQLTAICVGELVSHAYLSEIPALIEATGRQKQKEKAQAPRKPVYNQAFAEVADMSGSARNLWSELVGALDRMGAAPAEKSAALQLEVDYTEKCGKQSTIRFDAFSQKLSRHRRSGRK